MRRGRALAPCGASGEWATGTRAERTTHRACRGPSCWWSRDLLDDLPISKLADAAIGIVHRSACHRRRSPAGRAGDPLRPTITTPRISSHLDLLPTLACPLSRANLLHSNLRLLPSWSGGLPSLPPKCFHLRSRTGRRQELGPGAVLEVGRVSPQTEDRDLARSSMEGSAGAHRPWRSRRRIRR